MTYTLVLADCTRETTGATDLVGGKAIGLGMLLGAGLPVPPGFAVTTEAYRASVAGAGLADRIERLLGDVSEVGDAETSRRIMGLFDDTVLSGAVAEEIRQAYAALSGGDDFPVAVRSSATAEDRADASFAGQQDTYLWIQGEDEVLRHVVRCWASLFTPRAIGYRARVGVPVTDLAMGVVVQQMVPADAAGVMMTLEPVQGDRQQIYLESAFGLGEGVVRGDVGSDRFWVDKSTFSTRRQEIGLKKQAHCFIPEAGEVGLVDVPTEQQEQPSLTPDEVVALARLGSRIEQHFAMPMDIEWAIAAGDNGRTIYLLQARPETVWSRKSGRDDAADLSVPQAWDPLHSASAQDLHWTASNSGEAMPGVLTPLSWSMWADAIERAPREAAYRIGALTRAERRIAPRVDERATRIFFGRPAIQVEFFALLGDRMPGTTGEATVRSLFGRVPGDMTFAPTRRRYPFVAALLPYAFVTTPKRIKAFARQQDDWYHQTIPAVNELDLAGAARLLAQARARQEQALIVQVMGTLAVIQPLYNALVQLAERHGFDDISGLTAVGGGVELQLVADIWEASRGRLTLDEVQRRHGFHGPAEGEISSQVWRHNPAPLKRLIDEYAGRDDSDDPRQRERRHAASLRVLEGRFLASLPRAQRPIARLLLRLAAAGIPLRGVAKRSFLQAFDVGRAAAVRIGHLLHEAGTIAAPDDVFYLTVEEITGILPSDLAAVITNRRQRRRAYQELLPLAEWTGQPVPTRPPPPSDNAAMTSSRVIHGVGVSPGVVEGTARVVTSPDDESVVPDEILIAPFTDPSWSSLLFISAALVVDIGGALSHAAVVAREMEVPCVVNTRTGTTELRTGDRLRVDGTNGTVEIIERPAI